MYAHLIPPPPSQKSITSLSSLGLAEDPQQGTRRNSQSISFFDVSNKPQHMISPLHHLCTHSHPLLIPQRKAARGEAQMQPSRWQESKLPSVIISPPPSPSLPLLLLCQNSKQGELAPTKNPTNSYSFSLYLTMFPSLY